jgi:cytoskeletal protein CcmA (bactofilin family)
MFTKKLSNTSGDDGDVSATAQVMPPPPRPRTSAGKAESALAGIGGDGIILIGKGTRVIGEISDCTTVEIQGVVEGKLLANSVVIREGGGFKGSLQVDQAEIHGVMEGNAVVNDLLDIRSTGTVAADLAYGRLSVEAGGQMTGNILARISIENSNAPKSASTEIATTNGNGRHSGNGWT